MLDAHSYENSYNLSISFKMSSQYLSRCRVEHTLSGYTESVKFPSSGPKGKAAYYKEERREEVIKYNGVFQTPAHICPLVLPLWAFCAAARYFSRDACILPRFSYL